MRHLHESQKYTKTLIKNLVTSKQKFLMNFLADPESLQNAPHTNVRAKRGRRVGWALAQLLLHRGKGSKVWLAWTGPFFDHGTEIVLLVGGLN